MKETKIKVLIACRQAWFLPDETHYIELEETLNTYEHVLKGANWKALIKAARAYIKFKGNQATKEGEVLIRAVHKCDLPTPKIVKNQFLMEAV